MRPVDTVHYRTLLYDALGTEYMDRFFDIWITRDQGARYAFPEREIRGLKFPWTGRMVGENNRRVLQMAEQWYASADIVDVIEAMRQKMPPEVMAQTDPPSSHGFLLLEKPWLQYDVHGKVMPIRAIMWSTRVVGKGPGSGNGLVVWGLIDLNDRAIDDYWRYGGETERIARAMLSEGVNLTPASIFCVTFGAYALELIDQQGTWIIADDIETSIEDNGDATWMMTTKGASEVVTGGASEEVIRRFPKKDSRRVRPEPIISFLQCLWRFQEQEIVSVERDHLRKTIAKQLQRRQMLDTPVSVIHWRKRMQTDDKGERQYELQHRFVVRGHWRRQWYPSEQRHKNIYIQPFLKGPDNAPILMRERVNAVVR